MRRKDTDAVSDKVAKRVNELANRMEENCIELPKMQSKMSADFIVVSASKKTGEVSKGVATILKDPLTSALLIFKPEPEYKTGL